MGTITFIDTSVFVAILTQEADWLEWSERIAAGSRCLTSPAVRLETSIVVATRLLISLKEAERQYDRLLEESDIGEIALDSQIGGVAVACFERFGKGRHPARLNFADCLSYACARAHGATLLFKGDDFSKTDINDQTS